MQRSLTGIRYLPKYQYLFKYVITTMFTHQSMSIILYYWEFPKLRPGTWCACRAFYYIITRFMKANRSSVESGTSGDSEAVRSYRPTAGWDIIDYG